MHKELREFKKKQIEFDTWLTNNGGFTARHPGLSDEDQTVVVVPAERVFEAFMLDHPEADRDFVMAQVRKAQGTYSGVRVFADSVLANRLSAALE